MGLTRRRLLERIGTIGGASAAYLAMEAMGLALPTPAGAENFALAQAVSQCDALRQAIDDGRIGLQFHAPLKAIDIHRGNVRPFRCDRRLRW